MATLPSRQKWITAATAKTHFESWYVVDRWVGGGVAGTQRRGQPDFGLRTTDYRFLHTGGDIKRRLLDATNLHFNVSFKDNPCLSLEDTLKFKCCGVKQSQLNAAAVVERVNRRALSVYCSRGKGQELVSVLKSYIFITLNAQECSSGC